MDEVARFSRLVLMIQEAALDPTRWNDTVSALAEEVGASDGILFSPFLPPSLGGFWASGSIQPSHMEDYAAYYISKDAWRMRVHPQVDSTAGVVYMGEQIICADEMRSTEFYNDFLKPQNIGRLLSGFVLPRENSAYQGGLHLSLFRSLDDEGFDREELDLIQRLIPHLQVAVRGGQILNGRGAGQDLGEAALNVLGTAVIIVDRELKVLFSNCAAEKLFAAADGLVVRQGVLGAELPAEAASLRSLVSALFDPASAAGQMPVRRFARPSQNRAYICFGQLLPAESAPAGAACGRAFILFLRDPEQELPVDPADLRQLYDLTAAEAELAASLARGLSLEEAAARRGISYETARTQLKSLFQKTGCRKQSQLVALLLNGRCK